MRRFLFLLTCLLSVLCGCTQITQIEEVAVQSVRLSASSLELVTGECQMLTATVLPENATVQNTEWKSSNKNIARVSKGGLVTAVSPGTCDISVMVGSVSASCHVVVSEAVVPVSSVVLDRETANIYIYDVFVLTATILPENASVQKVTWASSDASIAKVGVDTGQVTGLAEGEAVITATAGDKSASCTITVSKKIIPVSSISLDNNTADLLVGEALQLTATVLPDNATDRSVTWTSSNADVATVENGLVTALAEGKATITATAGEKTATCSVTVTVPFSYGGLCLEAITDGYLNISNSNELTIEYKIENKNWKSTSDPGIGITVKAGERVWFRGHNESCRGIIFRDGGAGTFYLYGNLMSLIAGDDFEDAKELTGDEAFYNLFFGNARLYNHPTKDIELPATTLTKSCYSRLFYWCSNLTRAPKLPAKILTESCYSYMFYGCTSLKEFPEMAATDMAYDSCAGMMMESGIEEAPELPAMNLARRCYSGMFAKCPNLRKAMSVLPATILAPACYDYMFSGSEKLENSPQLPATELNDDCYFGMFRGCISLKDAPELPSISLKYECYSHMFEGCSSLKKAPELPAKEIDEYCYMGMFMNSGILEAPEDLPAINLYEGCYREMFSGCVNLKNAPILPAPILKSWCYTRMFQGCSNIDYVKMLATQRVVSTWTGEKTVTLTSDNFGSLCQDWLEGAATTGTFVKSAEAVWDVTGPSGVPEGWTIQYE